MKSITLFNAVLCSLIVFTLAYSQGRERPDVGPPNGRLHEKLNLSDTQKKDFEKLNSEFAKQKVEQQAKIKIAAIELHTLMKADSPDRGAIEKKINEISDLQAQNRMLGVDHWFSVNKLLNPDQQKIWKGMLDRPLRARFAARMERMRDRMMRRSHQETMPPENQEE
jgi:Spy/CpxP family protein refolding chaperone